MLQKNYEDYEFYRPIYFGLNMSLVYSFFLKIMFNVFAASHKREKIPIDKWTQAEIFCAVVSLLMMYLLMNTSVENLMNHDYKNYLDYLICALSLIQFSRFFLYYLVINSVSRMLLTLIGMLVSCIPFIVLFVTFWFIATQT